MGKRRYQPEKAFKKIGLKVRELRESHGWTLEDLDEESGLTWQQIQKIESGRNITVRTIIRLANAFGVHPTALLEDV